MLNWQRFCEVVIELYYQEVWLVLDNIYIRMSRIESLAKELMVDCSD